MYVDQLIKQVMLVNAQNNHDKHMVLRRFVQKKKEKC